MAKNRLFSTRHWLALVLWMAVVPIAFAQVAADPFSAFTKPSHEVRTPEVTARLLAWAPQGVAAGKPLWLGLQLQPAPGWHTYWKNPGQSGAATTLQWQLPQGMAAGEIAWPAPMKLPFGDLANYGYDESVLLAVPVKVDKAFAPQGEQIPIVLHAQWLACNTVCLPQEGKFELHVPAEKPTVADASDFKAQAQTVPHHLSGATLKTTVDAEGLTFTAQGLPPAWRGKTLNIYPENPSIIPAAAAGEQRWQGSTWQIRLPLEPQRSASPKKMAVVLALQANAAAGDAAARNQPGEKTYRLEAPVQGNWPPATAVAAPSPALEAALAANAASSALSAEQPLPASPAPTFWAGLGLAFLGGVLLNFMPCVFPLLAIKVLGLLEQAQHPRVARTAGVAYTLGTVLSLLLLASGWLLLRAGGQQLGWGFQLQNPYLVALLAALMLLVSLNLLGVFEIGQWLPAGWAENRPRHAVVDAFLSGGLTVLLASPCAAPFLGLALGFALVLPAGEALLLFACMGLGLALPMALFSFFPRLLAYLPKPGAWMQRLRHIMALPVLATVAWLAWVLYRQSGATALAVLLALLLLLAALVWVLQRQGKLRTVGTAVCAVLLAGFAAAQGHQLAAAPAAAEIKADGIWQPWSPEKVQAAIKAGQPVFVDYTADWCMTCQFNKQTVLNHAEFAELARQHKLLLLRADWTRQDAAIGQSLRRLKRAAVPVYAVYLPKNGGQAVLLNEILSLEAVQETLSAH